MIANTNEVGIRTNARRLRRAIVSTSLIVQRSEPRSERTGRVVLRVLMMKPFVFVAWQTRRRQLRRDLRLCDP